MAEDKRCPVCGERVPQPPPGTRGRKPVYCEQTEGACYAFAKAERAQSEALVRIAELTTSHNSDRMRFHVSNAIKLQQRDLSAELSSAMSYRRGEGRRRKSAKAP